MKTTHFRNSGYRNNFFININFAKPTWMLVLLFGCVLLGNVVQAEESKTAKKNVTTDKNTDKKKSSKKTNKSQLTEVVTKYKKNKLVKMDVTKTIKSNLLGKETKFKGQIYLTANKFRWDNEEPEKTQIIFDGKTIWNIQHPSKELPGPIQIAKSKLDNKSKKQILISTLLSNDGLEKNFSIFSTKIEGDESVFKLVPKGNELNVKDLEIKIQNKKIVLLSYKDDVGNLTTLNFSNIEFNEKSSNEVFSYKPPKDAQVTNL